MMRILYIYIVSESCLYIGIGIEHLTLHCRYEAGPIVNDSLCKLGASIALVWR